jgi:DNA-binding transcriptional LysR family regulator
MKRNLPPLKALHVFEVAAKLESFSDAADTLFVTQGAISKQIKLLEEKLRTRLFERQGGSVHLTVEGKNYLAIISQALDIIEAGSEKFYSEQATETLIIDILPSLSALWMFSRVEQFQERHSGISLQIDSSDDIIDWNTKRADIAIRCLSTEKKHADGELLLTENLRLIASPALLKNKPISAFEDLYAHKLLTLRNRPQLWQTLFAEHQLETRLAVNSFECEHFYMVIQAVIENFGIALVPDFLCEDLIQKGQLINPLNTVMKSHYGYYFISQQHKKDERKVVIFKEWMKDQLSLYIT